MRTRFPSLMRAVFLVMVVSIAPEVALASDFPNDYIAKALAEAVGGKSINIDGLAAVFADSAEEHDHAPPSQPAKGEQCPGQRSEEDGGDASSPDEAHGA